MSEDILTEAEIGNVEAEKVETTPEPAPEPTQDLPATQ